MSWFTDLFGKRTKDWFFAYIPHSQTPGNVEYKTIVAGEEYLNIMLKSMRIVNVRKGFSKFYAAVHSHIELGHIVQGKANFNMITSPFNLEKLDSSNLDRVVSLDRRLLGPVPYAGGDVKMEIGLFSIKEADLAKPFIELLTNISNLGGVSFINAALPYVKPLEDGIKLLTGSDSDTVLEIGYHTEMASVQTGYLVVMRADRNEIKLSDLYIDSQDYRLVNIKTKKSIADYPYMVLSIEGTKSRTDWYNIPDVAKSYNQITQAIQSQKYTEAKEYLKAFRNIVMTNGDLIRNDAELLYGNVEKDINKLLANATSKFEKFVQLEIKSLINYNTEILTSESVIQAFGQEGKNNCVTIGIIKLAISTYQINSVFNKVEMQLDDSYLITLRNGTVIHISKDELLRWSNASGFKLNLLANREISERILDFAHLCFAVIVKYIMTKDKLSEKESLYQINGVGINSDYAYLLLGLKLENVQFLTLDNAGTPKVTDYASNERYLLYNSNHCVMATKGYYDEYGNLTPIESFVKKHSSFFKPGKRCWAYLIK